MSGHGTSVCHVLQLPCHVMSCPSTLLVSCQAKVYQSLARFIHCHVISVMSCCSTPLVSCQAKVYQSLARFIHCHVISVVSCCSTPLVSCQAKVYQSLALFIHCHVMLQHTTGVMSGQGVPEPGTVYPLLCHVAAHHWCHVRPRCTRAWHGLSTGLIACWCPHKRPSTRTTLAKSSTPSLLASRYHWPPGLQNCRCFCCGLECRLLVCCRNANYQCTYEQNYAMKHSMFH